MSRYFLFEIIGIAAGALTAWMIKMPAVKSDRKLDVYICGVLGMLIGMKAPVILTYGFSGDMLINGKSYMGGLLGAFTAINLYKAFSHQTSASFGGRFVIPLAVAAGFGKIGCYMNGCCGGNFILPVQFVESVFQFLAALLLFLFYFRTKRADLLFPIYLLAYLVMRFLVEFIRTEPRVIGPFTIYHILAAVFIPILIYIIARRSHAGVCQ
ncbi:prolipoprotein diacylglyceryl transferase [bacterium]|nr:prolipoprotein diacylglyceryl transferase [bacterium]